MANNRMYLVNKNSGEKIYLAKYYPSTGWYSLPDIENQMDLVFEKNMTGSNLGLDWILEYEDDGQ